MRFSPSILPNGAIAIAGGLAWAAAFPLPGWPGLAWVAPALILLATLGHSPKGAFGYGYLAGLAHNLFCYAWLLRIPFPAGAVAGWIALSLYLALYPACWAWLCNGFLKGSLSTAAATQPWTPVEPEAKPTSTLQRLRAIVHHVALAMTWSARARWALVCAGGWTALEMIRGLLLTGFPWNFLGASQYSVLPLVQLASVTGVYGVSFLVAWCSVALLCAGLALVAKGSGLADSTRQNQHSRVYPAGLPRPLLGSLRLTLFADLALPFLALSLVTFSGARRLVAPHPTARELRIALVQPSIPQRLIFDPRETTNRFRALMDLTQLALAASPELVVWPEAALPGLGEDQYRELTHLIAAHRVWMIFGADDVDSQTSREGATTYQHYNSAFLFNPQGRYVTTYRKRRLVIFGEYVPLERWLPWVKHLTPIEGSFTPGGGPVCFELTTPPARILPLICFEDTFPQLVRESANADLDFLLNLTNDGWFGESAAQWQHAANAVYRAVENGLPLVRCCNNGLTCWVDPLGRLREAPADRSGDAYGPGFKVFRLPLPDTSGTRDLTPYHRYGDWFGWGCAGWVALRWLGRRFSPPGKVTGAWFCRWQDRTTRVTLPPR